MLFRSSSGRDAFQLSIFRRSGEHSTVGCNWSFLQELVELTVAFRDGASDRWAYHLRAELPILEGLDEHAFGLEMGRLLARSDEATKARFTGRLPQAFRRYCIDYGERFGREKRGDCLRDFVTLCQSASFLARGRDE